MLFPSPTDYADQFCIFSSLLRKDEEPELNVTSNDQRHGTKSVSWTEEPWSVAVFSLIPVLVLIVIVAIFLIGRSVHRHYYKSSDSRFTRFLLLYI